MKRTIMNKIALVAAVLTLASFAPLHAQWTLGVKGAVGVATISDDLSTNGPVVGASVGGFVTLDFKQSASVLAEIFYLQSGLNIIRRGSNFETVLEYGNSLMHRKGYYHAYYAQIPVLAGVHMELPVRKAGHVVGVYLGPAIDVGIFGRCKARQITPGVSSRNANYDLDVTGSAKDRAVFSHLNRIDVSAIVGVSYEYQHLTVTAYIDHGFLATSKEDDLLRIIENASGVSTKIPNGNNSAWMLGVGYSF